MSEPLDGGPTVARPAHEAPTLKNRHATRHFHATKHPVIQSFQPGESWKWCYVDEIGID